MLQDTGEPVTLNHFTLLFNNYSNDIYRVVTGHSIHFGDDLALPSIFSRPEMPALTLESTAQQHGRRQLSEASPPALWLIVISVSVVILAILFTIIVRVRCPQPWRRCRAARICSCMRTVAAVPASSSLASCRETHPRRMRVPGRLLRQRHPCERGAACLHCPRSRLAVASLL